MCELWVYFSGDEMGLTSSPVGRFSSHQQSQAQHYEQRS